MADWTEIYKVLRGVASAGLSFRSAGYRHFVEVAALFLPAMICGGHG